MGLGLASIFYSLYYIYDVQDIPMDVKVQDHVGFNLDTDALHFGIVMSPGYAGRSIVVTHPLDRPLQVVIQTSGEIAPWVEANYWEFVLQPGETKSVLFELYCPEGVEPGNYSGNVRVTFKRIF